MIRSANASDAKKIADIYNYYVEHSVSTFEETPVAAEVIEQKMASVKRLRLPWLIAEANRELTGYAYATQWIERSAYRYAVEISIYLSPLHTGRGLGTQLYTSLFKALHKTDIHLVVGGITLPNPASVALHEKFGMTKVAHFKEIGYKFNRWLDVGYWQKIIKQKP